MLNFDFHHINLIPKKCIIDSRSECDTTTKLGKHTFKLPVVPANMSSIINEALAEKMAQEGYFYILHRFGIDQVSFIQRMKIQGLISSISIGVNQDSYDLLNELIGRDLIPDYITIDIAHGHSVKMIKLLNWIKYQTRLKSVFIIAGNVSTVESADELIENGANAIKVGIAPGAACTTYMETGFGSRNIQPVVLNLINEGQDWDYPIILDGGIKNRGDIAKALALGATMVMVGSLFSGYNETSVDLKIENGVTYNVYYGSASERQKGISRVEGKSIDIVFTGESIFNEFKRIEESLQSAISYAGGKDIKSLNGVDFYVIK